MSPKVQRLVVLGTLLAFLAITIVATATSH